MNALLDTCRAMTNHSCASDRALLTAVTVRATLPALTRVEARHERVCVQFGQREVEYKVTSQRVNVLGNTSGQGLVAYIPVGYC